MTNRNNRVRQLERKAATRKEKSSALRIIAPGQWERVKAGELPRESLLAELGIDAVGPPIIILDR